MISQGSHNVGQIWQKSLKFSLAKAVKILKTLNVTNSAPRLARLNLTADLDTWQCRLHNFKKYMSCHYAKLYTVQWLYEFIYCIEVSSMPTGILAKYAYLWPNTSIRVSILYTSLRLYESPLHPSNNSKKFLRSSSELRKTFERSW
jgi:hypothetical protein